MLAGRRRLVGEAFSISGERLGVNSWMRKENLFTAIAGFPKFSHDHPAGVTLRPRYKGACSDIGFPRGARSCPP